MTITAAVKPPRDYVPATFEDLFRNYYGFVTHLVRKAGIEEQSAEDIAATILAKFLEKNALEDFRPDYVSTYDGVEHKAVFTTFLSGFVMVYLRHHRERQGVRLHREPVICDMPVESHPGKNWVELNAPHVWDEDERAEMYHADLVRRIRERLEALPPSPRSQMNLPALFARVVEEVQQTGGYNARALAKEFGVSPWTIHKWMDRMRDEVSHLLDD
jgi:DNA-directed RNA polymerase specialized sigma24 family protein